MVEPTIPATRSLRQKEPYKLEATLDYIVRPYLKNTNRTRELAQWLRTQLLLQKT